MFLFPIHSFTFGLTPLPQSLSTVLTNYCCAKKKKSILQYLMYLTCLQVLTWLTTLSLLKTLSFLGSRNATIPPAFLYSFFYSFLVFLGVFFLFLPIGCWILIFLGHFLLYEQYGPSCQSHLTRAVILSWRGVRYSMWKGDSKCSLQKPWSPTYNLFLLKSILSLPIKVRISREIINPDVK